MRQLLKKKKRHAASAWALRRQESGQRSFLGIAARDAQGGREELTGIRSLRGSVG